MIPSNCTWFPILGRERDLNHATGESLSLAGMPYRCATAATAPPVPRWRPAIVRIDERGSET